MNSRPFLLLLSSHTLQIFAGGDKHLRTAVCLLFPLFQEGNPRPQLLDGAHPHAFLPVIPQIIRSDPRGQKPWEVLLYKTNLFAAASHCHISSSLRFFYSRISLHELRFDLIQSFAARAAA